MDAVRYLSSVDSLHLPHKIKIYFNVITEYLEFWEGALPDLYFIRTVMWSADWAVLESDYVLLTSTLFPPKRPTAHNTERTTCCQREHVVKNHEFYGVGDWQSHISFA